MTYTRISSQRLAAAVLCVLAAVVSVPVPAQAGSEVHADSRRDVNVERFPSDTQVDRPARQARFADITQLTSTYRHHHLILRTGFRELVSRPHQVLYLGIDIEAEGGRIFTGQLLYSAEHGVSSITFYSYESLPKGCFDKALRGHVSLRQQSVTIVVPARCLGRPEWVRTGAGSFVERSSPPYRAWRDDARAPYRKPDLGGTYTKPTFGPRIRAAD